MCNPLGTPVCQVLACQIENMAKLHEKGTLQIFIIAMHLTVLLPSLINWGYTQVYEIIFTQHPPDIGTMVIKVAQLPQSG